MPDENKMSIDERWKYLRIMHKRYREANRNERGKLLNEMEETTGMHRKSLIRRLNGCLTRKKPQRHRSRSYGPEVDDALRVIAEALDYICAERLQPDWVRSASLPWDASSGGSDRMSRACPAKEQSVPIGLPGAWKRNGFPGMRKSLGTSSWIWSIPRSDLRHCGPTTSGNYLHTLQMIDVATHGRTFGNHHLVRF